jgi:GNAT superfamily N-acetyltransferase
MANAKIPGQSQKFWEEYIGSSLQDDLADIDGTYFARGGHYWVAVCDKEDGSGEEVVGMVGLEHKGRGEGELRRMSVKADYRRYGLGRMLVATLEDWAIQNGFTRIWLSAGYVLEKAHAFYKSMGYAIFKDEVFYEKPLFILAFFEKQLVPVASVEAN